MSGLHREDRVKTADVVKAVDDVVAERGDYQMSRRELEITYPDIRKPPPGERPAVSAVALLRERPIDLLALWKTDPLPPSSPTAVCDYPLRSPVAQAIGTDHFPMRDESSARLRWKAESPKRLLGQARHEGEVERRVLGEHSRSLFKTVNDRLRAAGALGLRERLFLFYKRFQLQMLPMVGEIADYWGDDERTLDRMLLEKYHSNLELEGLGAVGELTVQVDELQDEMTRHGVAMTAGAEPTPEWIPQHAEPLAGLAHRDALLLTEAQLGTPASHFEASARSTLSSRLRNTVRSIPLPGSALPPRPASAWDNTHLGTDTKKSYAVRPHTSGWDAGARSRNQEQRRGRQNLAWDEEGVNPLAERTSIGDDKSEIGAKMWTVSLSLNQQVIGVRPFTQDSLAPSDLSRSATPLHLQPLSSRRRPRSSLNVPSDPNTPKFAFRDSSERFDVVLPSSEQMQIGQSRDPLAGSTKLKHSAKVEALETSSPSHTSVDVGNRGFSRYGAGDEPLPILEAPMVTTEPTMGLEQKGDVRLVQREMLDMRLVQEQGDSVPTIAVSAFGESPLDILREQRGSNFWIERDQAGEDSEMEEDKERADGRHWERVASKTHGREYFYNRLTGESRWTLPPVFSSTAHREQQKPARRKAQPGVLGLRTKDLAGSPPRPSTSEKPQADRPQFSRPSTAPAENRSHSSRQSQRGQVAAPSEAPRSAETEVLVCADGMVSAETDQSTGAADAGLPPVREDTHEQRRGDGPAMRIGEYHAPHGSLVRRTSSAAVRRASSGSWKLLRRKRSFVQRSFAEERADGYARGILARWMIRKQHAENMQEVQELAAERLVCWWRSTSYRRRKELEATHYTEAPVVTTFSLGKLKARLLGRRWLQRTRRRMQHNTLVRASICVQRYWRGVLGRRMVVKMHEQILTDACVKVQRAWRERLEWKTLVMEEERRTRREAYRIRKEYLFGVHSKEAGRLLRERAEAAFEENTSDLGRSKTKENQQIESGSLRGDQGKFDWMQTLRALMAREAASQNDPIGQGDTAERRPGAGIASVMAYTHTMNPVEVQNSIAKQRANDEECTRLLLPRMGLLRFPFGISDSLTGRKPWVALQTIHLSHNLLNSLPDDFFVLTNLVELRLDHNNLQALSPLISRLVSLKTLNLHCNQLAKLPAEIGGLRAASLLSLDENQLRVLPFQICNLSHLIQLSLRGNPDMIQPPKALALRAHTKAGVDDVVEFLTRFHRAGLAEHAYVLDIRGYSLAEMPDLRSVATARAMDLSHNRFTDLTIDQFWDSFRPVGKQVIHHSLTSLSIAHNRFAHIPLLLSELITLKEIDCSNNKIVELPVQLLVLTNLTALNADGNPLSSPTIHVVKDGVEVYRLRGSTRHPKLMGLYAKTDARRNGRRVYALTGVNFPAFLFSFAFMSAGESTLVGQGSHGARKTAGESWCVGPDPDNVQRAWLRVMDGGLRPSDIRSVWRERSDAGFLTAGPEQISYLPVDAPRDAAGRLVRCEALQVSGHGVWEYLVRVQAVQGARDSIRKMRREMDANDARMLQASGMIDGEARLQIRNAARSRIKAAESEVELDMSALSMTLLPPEIIDKTVRSAKMDFNAISEITPSFFRLPLTRWSMHHNNLSRLSSEIGRLSTLTSLDLSFNFITALPSAFSRLTSLRTCLLAANRLTEAPLVVASLGLRTLDLCRNPIPVLLPPFAALADLEHLHLSAACLSTLDLLEASQKRDICKRLGSSAVEGPEGEDAALEGMKRLETLDLDLNHLTEIPVSLAGATNLGDLSLSRNLISSLQALTIALPYARHLHKLDVSKNQITELPLSLAFLPGLTNLNLSFNHLHTFPTCVVHCPLLRVLNLNKNYLPSIPAEVGALTSLVSLDVSCNLLRSVSADLHTCTALKLLRIQHNNLRVLPPTYGYAVMVLGHLTCLEELDVSYNRLQTLPIDLAECHFIRHLNIDHNPFELAPPLQRALAPPLGTLYLTATRASGMRPPGRRAPANSLLSFSLVSLSDETSVRPPSKSLRDTPVPNFANRGDSEDVSRERQSIETSYRDIAREQDEVGSGVKSETEDRVATSIKWSTATPTWDQKLELAVSLDQVNADLEVACLHVPQRAREGDEQETSDVAALVATARDGALGAVSLGFGVRLSIRAVILRQDPFFNHFTLSGLRRLALRCQIVTIAPHEQLCLQGERCEACVLILDGSLHEARMAPGEQELEAIAPLKPGARVGDIALLVGGSWDLSLQAGGEGAVCLHVNRGEAFGELVRSETTHAVEALMLSLALTRDMVLAGAPPESQADSFGRMYSTDEAEARRFAWGTKEWYHDRDLEVSEVLELVKALSLEHDLDPDAHRHAVHKVQDMRDEMDGKAKSIFAWSIERGRLTPRDTEWYRCASNHADAAAANALSRESLADLVDQRETKAANSVEEGGAALLLGLRFAASGKVKLVLDTLRLMLRGGSAAGRLTEMKRLEELRKKIQGLRRTPDGRIFESDLDELRQDEHMRRVSAYMADLALQKAASRTPMAWELMPRMFHIHGSFDPRASPWDRSWDPRADYENGVFAGMEQILGEFERSDTSDTRVKGSQRNRNILHQLEVQRQLRYRRQGVPEEGVREGRIRPAIRTGGAVLIQGKALERWETLIGLLLVKPELLMRKEKARAAQAFQARQLGAIRDVQDHDRLREQTKALKRELGELQVQIEVQRKEMMSAKSEMRDQWNGAAVRRFTAARQRLDSLTLQFTRVDTTKSRNKALYKLQASASQALAFQSVSVVDQVFQILADQADPNLNPVAALANPQGGPMEGELRESVSVVDFEPPIARFSTDDVVSWVESNVDLAKLPQEQAHIASLMRDHDISGRNLVHLSKVDLLRMGLTGPIARLLLVQLQGLKTRLALPPDKELIRQMLPSARAALIGSEEEVIHFLMTELLVEEKSAIYIFKLFNKYDREITKEVTLPDLQQAAVFAGINYLSNPKILQKVRDRYDWDKSESFDLLVFGRIISDLWEGRLS